PRRAHSRPGLPARPGARETRREANRSLDGYLHALRGVVAETGCVPRRLERLGSAGAVGGAAAQLVLARRSAPFGAPALPGVRRGPRLERGLAPLAVHRELDPTHGRGARPGAADDLDPARCDGASARIEVRNAR